VFPLLTDKIFGR